MERFYGGGLEQLGAREVAIIASTNQLARDGHILEPAGIDLRDYLRNPIILWQHDPECPIAIATAIGVRDGVLAARIEFAPPGASTVADQACALVKSGIVRGVSIGFDPKEFEPLDPKRPRGGMHITKADLLEISFVSVPADTGAGVTARSAAHNVAAIVRALPRLPSATIQRAAGTIPRRRDGAILSPTMHVWALLEQRRREREDRYGYQARQAELRRLAAVPWAGGR